MKTKAIAIMVTALLLTCSLTACGSKSEETLTSVKPMMNGDAMIKGEVAEGAPAEADAPDAFARDEGVMYDMAPAAAAGGEAVGGAMADEAFGFEADGMFDAPAADIAGEPGIIEPEPAPEVPVSRPEVGILTAGEWRDHDNWGFFSNLVNNGTITFPSFGVDPTQRIAVTVSSEAGGEALPNTKVQLKDGSGTAIWNAVTDQNGTAYLFETGGRKGTSLYVVGADGAETEVPLEAAGGSDSQSVQLVSDRQVSVTLGGGVVRYPDTQVLFIVDTTGSMGDEMLYLQSDFGAIAEEVGTDRTSYAVSFYRDEGDEYVTRLGCGFTGDVSQIRSALNSEMADGGGDEPEAVAEALAEAFGMSDWREDAVKVAFLIFDAPPHTGKEASLAASIESAAAQGIHLIPVVSSNGSRETELFGRAAAICTNGSYVFLTDHSGVGSSHLEPIIGDYAVEKLHDVIVRIITQYQQK